MSWADVPPGQTREAYKYVIMVVAHTLIDSHWLLLPSVEPPGLASVFLRLNVLPNQVSILRVSPHAAEALPAVDLAPSFPSRQSDFA